MKVTGFSFVRNAVLYDYPVVEALSSILPICDAVVVAVGQSDDGTLELVKNIHPKVRVVETVWDDSLRHGGRVLAIETDKAFRAIAADSDWAFYLQADEVVHENDLDAIQAAMRRWRGDAGVDGLLFTYRHFYGSYGYVATSPRWYRREIRVVRNDKAIFSYHDAQGFRKGRNEKLRVKPVDACIYHYGWVKHPRAMQRKWAWFARLWHDDRWLAARATGGDEFDYSTIDALEPFTGTHPAVMRERIARCDWTFAHDPSRNRLSPRDRAAVAIERHLGIRIGERRNYVIV
jgi:glycosyltransferase involved in cell wall biosynthesis